MNGSMEQAYQCACLFTNKRDDLMKGLIHDGLSIRLCAAG